MKSLDPRVNRLPEIDGEIDKTPLDQLVTFEVFVQAKEGKPFQHEGALHASDREMAFILAKESFTRRFTCSSLFVVETAKVFVSPTTEGNESVYALLSGPPASAADKTDYEIFHLLKRGKQHIHFTTVTASSPEGAIWEAKNAVPSTHVVFNIWVIRKDDIRFTSQDEKDLWMTLPEKKFRDAAAYKGGEKLKEFLDRFNASNS